MPSLFVGSVGPHLSQESVQQAFTRYGPCVVHFRGAYAFVDFERDRDAEEAHRQMSAGKPASMVQGVALRVEWSHRSAPGGQASRSSPAANSAGYGAPGGGGPGACFECGATDHIARNCSARTERLRMGGGAVAGGGGRGQSADGRVCYNCGQAGHLARNCSGPRMKSDAPPDSTYHAARGPRQPDTRTCYECGQPGHLARDCPSKAEGGARRVTREEPADDEGEEEEEEGQNDEQYDEYEASASGSSAEYSRSPSQSGSEGASTPEVGRKRHPKESDDEAEQSVKRARPVEEGETSASADFDSMTVKQLKAEMEKRGLDSAGLKVKKDFVEALEKAVNAEA